MSEGKKSGLRPFSPETAPRTGRPKGARNRLNVNFIDDLLAAWETHGKEALRITAKEQPAQLVKIMASILPKEFEITDSRLSELSDEQIDTVLEIARRHLNGDRSPRSREKTPVH
jgi:hypothetical protein